MIRKQSTAEDCFPLWDSKADFAMIHSTFLQLETQSEIGSTIKDALQFEEYSNEAGYDMRIAGPII